MINTLIFKHNNLKIIYCFKDSIKIKVKIQKILHFLLFNMRNINKKLSIYGDGKNIRDWLHVDDHCEAIFKVLINGRSGEIYNVGGGQELSNLEITELILERMGADSSSIEFVIDRKGHDFRYSVDWSKIRGELGYYPKIDFKSGIQQTIEWYKNNESWWKPLKVK